jgi:hypothetical protein
MKKGFASRLPQDFPSKKILVSGFTSRVIPAIPRLKNGFASGFPQDYSLHPPLSCWYPVKKGLQTKTFDGIEA